MIIKDGELLPDVMRRERLSVKTCTPRRARRGCPGWTEVELAVLEADGKISFFAGSDKDSGAPEQPPVG